MTSPPIRQTIMQSQSMASSPTGAEVALVVRPINSPFGFHGDAAGRQRVSQITTLFDGKTLGIDDPRSWDTRGTGSSTFNQNKMNLSVEAGQYEISQSRHACPYFSGKSQCVEVTVDNFHTQSGVTKRMGYFSSNAVAPFDSDKDGFWIEDDGTTKRLIVSNAGTEKLNLPMAQWDIASDSAAYSRLQAYDWQNFTVMEFDFLWLGGAVLRMFLKLGGEFKLLHTFDYAGTAQDVFMETPNQPVRYEIRSSIGSGQMHRICSTVFTEGSIAEEGDALSVITTTAVSANVVGTVYAVKGIRKSATYRDIHTDVISFGGTVLSSGGTPDAGRFILCLNPTLSAPLTWTANSKVEEGDAAAGQTLSDLGRVLEIIGAVGTAASLPFPDNALSILRMGIDNVADQVILAYIPATATQSVHGHITIKED